MLQIVYNMITMENIFFSYFLSLASNEIVREEAEVDVE